MIVGAPGTVRGVAVTALDEALVPCPLTAATANEYEVPFVRPVTTHESGPLVQVQVIGPGVAVTT